MISAADELNADAAVYMTTQGCKNSWGVVKVLAKWMKEELGIPTLITSGDVVNERIFNLGLPLLMRLKSSLKQPLYQENGSKIKIDDIRKELIDKVKSGKENSQTEVIDQLKFWTKRA